LVCSNALTVSPILSRDRVRSAVARALLLDPEAGQEAAIASAAQALGLPVEVVRDAMEDTSAEPA
jgi:hypothetical protein